MSESETVITDDKEVETEMSQDASTEERAVNTNIIVYMDAET